MADNTVVSAAVGVGATIAADDIGGVLYPRSKISLGADGTAVDAGAGAGVVGTDTQRVTLGSDDPAVVSLQLIDNAISGAGFNVTQFAGAAVPIGAGLEATAVRVTVATDSTGVVSIDDNGGSITIDNAQLSVVGTGTEAAALRVTIASDSTGLLSVDDNGGSLTVDGTVTANAGSGTFVVSGAVTNAVLSVVGNGAAATAQRVTLANDSTGIVALTTSVASIGKLAENSGVDIGDVDITSIIPGTGATNLGKSVDSVGGATDSGVAALVIRDDALSTLTPVEGDYTTLRTTSEGALWVQTAGVVAVSTVVGSSINHDTADANGPIKIGAHATSSVSGETLVANSDRTDLYAGIDGVLITRQHCVLEDIVTATPVAITDGSSTSVLASPGAGLRNYITSISIANSSATFVTVDLRDGTAGAVLWTFPVPATGGVVYTFPVPLKFSAATAVAADPSASVSSVTVSVLGFKSKV
jgi:hypothetical protein